MAIKIIEEPDIYLTRAEHDRLHRMWVNCSSYTTAPQSFEDFVRSQKAGGGLTTAQKEDMALRRLGEA